MEKVWQLIKAENDFLIKGAYGEVRRACHKKTNIVRAVKIIYKDSTDKKEQKRVINEVNVLKKLVKFELLGF